ncbi:MAG: carboxylesterase family protein [Alistipes sp.]
MKKALLLFIFALSSITISAQTIEKSTHLFAVHGADSLYLDRYTTSTDAQTLRPCMLFVFGGGFVSGTRDAKQYLPYFNYIAQQGYDVVSLDYRLGLKNISTAELSSPEQLVGKLLATLHMATEDLYTATAFVLAHATQWGIDPSQMVTCGSSAGAITVLEGEYGICNQAALAQQILPKGFNYAGVISFAGAIFQIGQELVWNTNPAPILFFHGDADSNVPYDVVAEGGAGFFGSQAIVRQLAAKKSPYYFYSVENAAHEIATQPMNENRFEIDAFLEKLVRQHRPLMIQTTVQEIGKPTKQKTFGLADYIQSNFMN